MIRVHSESYHDQLSLLKELSKSDVCESTDLTSKENVSYDSFS